jgi:hypothetical protein
MLLISIYGPNSNDYDFFSSLRGILLQNKEIPTVCAGDWNTTYCTDPGENNIDIINMLAPPSITRSAWLAELCDEFNLSDPFRIMHVDRRDFTYVPRSGTKNRSRLDFFITSDVLIPLCNKCSIDHSLSTDLFDHKSIRLSFDISKKSNVHFINPTIFSHSRFEAVVAAAAVETYLQHAVQDQPDVDVDEGLEHIGRLIAKILQCNEIEFNLAMHGIPSTNDANLQACHEELYALVNTLPDPTRLNEIELSCAPDIFLDVLMGNIRNSLISFQAWINKVRQAKSRVIITNLNTLKADYMPNFSLIQELERQLMQLRDVELSAKIRELKIFEHLHNEKPSPLFLTLTRNKTNDSLHCIKDDSGQEFNSDEDRNKFILKFFSDIYSKTGQADHINYDQCISDFLGPDILDSELVRRSRITVQEREELDRPLTLSDLDDSLNSCNLKSAAGADGFSNKLIKKCWHFLRIPLHNYALHCFNSGILTTNFRSACIKLIPKKGDTSKLKNWRPISLLSNMYKIISRAINSRLKKVVNRICSRAQKGYNTERYVQEVLINICDTIAHCKSENLRGSILAVDMAKAFDSLDHNFIKAVYRFFGLGDTIINWLNLLGNQRMACIMVGDGSFTGTFNLDTGRAQGDNLSPNIFNFCEQILIFKLELDNRIVRIPRNINTILPIGTDIEVYSAETNRETSNNESLADDNTVLSIIDRESLLTIKSILEQFARFSGLHCNFDKTAILPIFPLSDIETTWIHDAGFSPTNKLKLLGAEITSNINDISDNFTGIVEKINALINYWSRFKLSLPGRISVAKTFLISQLTYLGAVFKPTDNQLRTMQDSINNFIRKNLKISDRRIYLPVDKGGVGFFNLGNFLAAQRTTWLLRAAKKRIDNWRYDLHVIAPLNNPLLIRSSDINANRHPILHSICESYEKFYSEFCYCDENYKLGYIYDNNAFRDPETGQRIGKNFFGNDFYDQHTNAIRSLNFNDCFSNLGFKTMREFAGIGLPLTPAMWMRIRNTLLHFKANHVQKNVKTNNISNFVSRWKKGGKVIRHYIQKRSFQDTDVRSSRSFLTFVDLIGTTVDVNFNLGLWTSIWNMSSLSNDFRSFIYNSRYNCLPLNNRLNAYKPEIDPSCTYCRITNNRPVPRDSMAHCFFYCDSVKFLLTDFLCYIGDDYLLDESSFLKLFWFGHKDGNKFLLINQVAYTVLFDSFRYIVFKNRVRGILPSRDNLKQELFNLLKWICQTNKKIKSTFDITFQGTRLARAIG